MRILLVTNGYPPAARGGVETYTQTLAHALNARGHTVEVFCRISALQEPEYALQRDNVESIPVWRVVNDLTDANSFEKHYHNPRFDDLFRQHVQHFQPELVHFQHCLGLSASLLEVAQSRALPTLVTLHDFWFFCPRATLFTAERVMCAGPQMPVDCVRCHGGVSLGWAGALRNLPTYKWLLFRLPKRLNTAARWSLEKPVPAWSVRSRALQRHRGQMRARTDHLFGLLRQLDRRFVPSEFLKAAYVAQGLAADSIDVLPLGIDLSLDAPRPRPATAEPIVAYLGSLQYHKGADVVISAYRAAEDLPGELRLYGAGAALDVYADRLRTQAATDYRIRLMGGYQRAALPAILADLDLLVVPSRWHETYSLAAREALLAGVPVIASKVGALADIIQDGVNGYLVPPGDASALADALRRALANLPALREGTRLTSPAPTLAQHVMHLEQHYNQVTESA